MRVLRLVPKKRPSIAARAGWTYFHLLTGLLVLISGVLVLALTVNLLGL